MAILGTVDVVVVEDEVAVGTVGGTDIARDGGDAVAAA